MKRKSVIRMLGFLLSFTVATSSFSSVLYAAEMEQPVVVENNNEQTATEESLDVAEDVEITEDAAATDEVVAESEESASEEEKEESLDDAEQPTEEPLEETESTPETSYNILSTAEEMKEYLDLSSAEGKRVLVYSEQESIDFKDATACVMQGGMLVLTYEDSETANTAYEA